MGELWSAAKEAGLWSWSPTDWAWSPETVRWSLDLGMPKAPVYFDVSTDAMPQHARYEMWRTLLYYSFEGDSLPADAARAFSARTQCLITDPVQLLHYRSKAVSGRGVPADRANDRETYTIGVVVAGRRTYAQEGAGEVVSRAGEFFVFDNRWSSRVAWSDHRAVQISVPRAELEQRIGERIPDPAAMVALLGGSPMGEVLKSQMLLAARHMVAANEVERDFMLGQLMQLALFACESATAHNPLRGSQRADLLGAALGLIEQNLGRPGLDARMLQAHLGCSRATLYRAFAEAGTSVSNAIAQMRIKRAKAILAGAPELPVGTVAARCGWYDSASFARAFRRHEGLSPSEFREKYRAI
ncbi:helix-turn-helix domain-containing protein [Erythrobacter sp. NE805]|uniref:AraC family transcriptional regulator n=1 Tax=Erythrobacter sp. NE805 TaxID=3389875 RepID=UPI00396B204F